MVSKHWANALMREWTAQALLEQEYHLKQSVMSSDDPLKEAESQIFFISFFAKPLLEMTIRAAPNLSMYYHHCKANLQSWHQRKAILFKQRGGEGAVRESLPPPPPPPSAASSPPTRQSDWYHSAFPLALPNYRPKPDNDSSRTTPSTCRSSDHGSQPQSPSCESESLSSSTVLSPISDLSYHSSTTSTSSINTTQSHIPSSHAAIRAASKSGCLKVQAQKNKKGNRNSWGSATSASAPSSMGVTTFSQLLPQPSPPFSLTLPTAKSCSSLTSPAPPLDKDKDNTFTTFSLSSSSCPRPLLKTTTPPPPPTSSTTPSNTSASATTPSIVESILTSGPIEIQVAP